MNKNKTFLMVFTALLIAGLSFSGFALAAEVSRVQTNRGHIYINQGKDAGFIMGTEVCVYDVSGEEITCGTVKQTNPNYAVIKVNNRLAKQIKVGMKALIGKPNVDQKDQ
ncbi:MAG: hypothetical protein JRI75_06180 [Deltaproteobacteria bacterium]|nr:hypothetical protein [Deltaproteobacteria bacterium]